MNVSRSWLIAMLAAAGCCGQAPPAPAPVPEPLKPLLPPDATEIKEAEKQLELSAKEIRSDKDFARIEERLARMQVRGRSEDTDREYEAGTRALDSRRYDDALARFDRVIENKGSRADGALYWKAYALNRLGRRDDALAALASLRQQYPNSPWVKDGQALEVEVRQSNGKPVQPADEANDDLKLMAINGLMHADPDRAIPLLEGVLKGNSSPQVKDRAMFVLTQNKSPRAKAILMQLAKGGANPDLQERAIRYIGMTGAPEGQQQLTEIYISSNDLNVKKAVLRSLMMAHATAALLNIAKTDKNAELRREAIRQLWMLHSGGQLAQLYAAEASPENKDEIINGLFMSGDAKSMVDLARRENDPERKKLIVSRLSMMHSKDATDYLMELLK